MKVLIIPEDQELDRYIVQPVVEALFQDLGKNRVQVSVLPEPRLRGINEALNSERLAGIIRDNPMVDLFLLIVDRDCNREGNEERVAARVAAHPDKLIGCLAVQEVEVWMLALHLDSGFSEVRRHCDPKEKWAEPLLGHLGTDGPGKGRKKAMRALTGKWRGLSARCEELGALQQHIRDWLAQQREP